MIELRTFDGSLDEIHPLIRASWLRDYRDHFNQPVIDYSSVPFLKWNLNGPSATKDLRIGAYLDDQLVGFAAGIPVTLKLREKTIQSVLGSFLTTHFKYKGRGIGKALAKEYVRRSMDMNFDLLYSVTDEGHAADNLFKSIAVQMGLPYQSFYRFTFLSKPLDRQKITELTILSFHQKLALPLITKKAGRIKNSKNNFNAETCLKAAVEMMNKTIPEKALSVNWSEDQLSYDLSCRLANVYYSDAKGKRGLILYYNLALLGCTSVEAVHPMTIIDCIRFENMSFYEKHKFISNFCSQEKEKGSCVVTVPTMPGFDLRPFYTNLFYPNGRYHCFVSCDFNNILDSSLHMDYLIFR